MSAQQILHVVLRGRDQDIDSGLVHETIQPIRIERDRGDNVFDDVEHDGSSFWTERALHRLRVASVAAPDHTLTQHRPAMPLRHSR
jgi:hypothetical protein